MDKRAKKISEVIGKHERYEVCYETRFYAVNDTVILGIKETWVLQIRVKPTTLRLVHRTLCY